MDKLKLIFNALATADKVEVEIDGDIFVASVNFCNNTADDNFYIDIRDADEYFPPIHLHKKQLNDSFIEGNKIKIDNYVIELYKFTEHNI